MNMLSVRTMGLYAGGASLLSHFRFVFRRMLPVALLRSSYAVAGFVLWVFSLSLVARGPSLGCRSLLAVCGTSRPGLFLLLVVSPVARRWRPAVFLCARGARRSSLVARCLLLAVFLCGRVARRSPLSSLVACFVLPVCVGARRLWLAVCLCGRVARRSSLVARRF